MPVGEICNREVVIINKKEGILDAAKLMRDHHVGNVIVVEEKEGVVIPVGILTDRDIVVELIAKEVPLDSVVLEDVMSADLVSVQENMGIWDTIQCMRSKGIRRIVVTGDKGNLVGIISSDDLIDLLSGELSDVVKTFMREQNREKETKE
ncbi:MAG: CBS domain-containing protein [Syntrophaceae bacterium]|nr:CBS domain-containing protein [Syntrophaceae bacterium]